MQVAKSAASLARMGRRGASHLGNIAPKPASVGKAKLGGLAALAGKAEKKIAESQVWPSSSLHTMSLQPNVHTLSGEAFDSTLHLTAFYISVYQSS